jgi:hypothetical protein
MIQGRATTEGTARYRDRFRESRSGDHFENRQGLWISSVGLGTYLGEPDEADDRAYEEATARALTGGCNVLDSAINYRFQRSERSLGRAIRGLVEQDKLRRDEFLVATKGGFVPFDGGYPDDPAAWVRSTFLEPGLMVPGDLVAGCHCMTPAYLDHQFEASRVNLGLEAVDIYYVHNPETQLQEIGRDEFRRRLRAAFRLLEGKVAEGKLGLYGAATWDGFRKPPGDPARLSLAEVLEDAAAAAREAGSGEHHFGAVQLPLNLAMPEALLAPTQEPLEGRGSGPRPFLESAAPAGLILMASASILQGHLPARIPSDLAARIPGADHRPGGDEERRARDREPGRGRLSQDLPRGVPRPHGPAAVTPAPRPAMASI